MKAATMQSKSIFLPCKHHPSRYLSLIPLLGAKRCIYLWVSSGLVPVLIQPLILVLPKNIAAPVEALGSLTVADLRIRLQNGLPDSPIHKGDIGQLFLLCPLNFV
ncbi:hypothetical protein Pyn_29859 [Prunus yedoensis var. nudiflora]|uniref:Uncharacterized protein n=1 Tax=Prunus yedoensis var. nudiflora TaxID=2094558 RepID=A0A314YNN0_PRUYE|nr:hypothetical protein Pyn_29859 [Prunus yedoensis var. nudiflora]